MQVRAIEQAIRVSDSSESARASPNSYSRALAPDQMHWISWLSITLSCVVGPTVSSISNRSNTLFLALICEERCAVHIRFLEQSSTEGRDTKPAFNVTMESANGTLHDTTMDIADEVNIIEFVYTSAADENGTTAVVTDVWDLSFTDAYFHSTASMKIVGNLPCGRYGCAQSPLCDGVCRFTIIVSIVAFCLSILAAVASHTVYASFLGFRRIRKTLELRDTIRLTETENFSSKG